MEVETRKRNLESSLLETGPIKRQLEILKKAVDEAQKSMDYEAAHDKEVMMAIRIVEQFLRKTGRVCYGGQAINAHLPAKLRFYNPEFDVPDFDFFSPSGDKDVNELVLLLQKEGFKEISEKAGVHEGTRKLYVNLVPIADITSLSPDLYKKYAKNSITVAGIRYVNEDILRMMMYLELSRPRGEVDRWSKVFERLTLLNTAKPIQRCTERTPRIHSIPPRLRQKVLEYLIQEKRVLAGAEIGFIYRTFADQNTPKLEWFVRSGGPILFFSPDLPKDTDAIVEILGSKGLTIQKKEGYGEYIPARVVIRKSRQIIAYLIEESSCNSYNDIPLETLGVVRIASLDTLVYLYLMLGLITDEAKTLGVSLLCLAQRYAELLNKIRHSRFSRFPLFTIKCSGHQTSLISLIRERAKRINRSQNRTLKHKKKGKHPSQKRTQRVKKEPAQ